MALSQSDLIRLLESLRSSDGIELVRSVAERMLQELIEAEVSAHIGAGWNEHTELPESVPQRAPGQDPDHAGRRSGPGDPQAPHRQFLPQPAGTPAAHRPGPLRGDHGSLCPWGLHPLGR